jgi:hypothetical protein
MKMEFNIELRKIKVHFSPDIRVMPMMDKMESYHLHIEDFTREKYILYFTLTGTKYNLQRFLDDYDFDKPLEYYML